MNKTLKSKAKTKPESHSSYWFGDYFDTFDRMDKSDPKRVYKLATGKRSIANFVTIATGKAIPVIFSGKGNSYTDSKHVVIGSDIDSPKDFDVAVGLALHEASHIAYTDFSILGELTKLIGESRFERARAIHVSEHSVKSTVKDILNVIEDRRLDNLSYQAAPGYREYYVKMYDKYFNAKIIDKALGSNEYTTEDIESYMFRIINLHNPNTRIKVLKGLPEIWSLIDLKNIGRLKTTKEALEVSLNVFDVILKYLELEAEEKKAEGGNDENEENEESTNSQASSSESSEGETGEDENGGEGKGETDGEGEDEENPFGSGANTTNGSGQGVNDGSDSEGEELTQLSDNMKKQLEKAAKKQKDFVQGNVQKKQLSKKDANEVKEFESTNSEIRQVGTEFTYNGKPIDVLVVNKVGKSFIEASTPITSRMASYQSEVNEGMAKGRILGKKLQVRSESRTTVFNRQKTGKIDKRMISSLGFGNQNVFFFNEIDEYKDANLHISLDASSSMGGSKWKNSIITVTAICTAVEMIEGLDVQVTLRTGSSFGGRYVPYVAKVYDSREDKPSKIKWLFPHLKCSGTTPEGLCFEALDKDFISKSNKKDSYFLNISDGMPYFEGRTLSNSKFDYQGSGAYEHTRKQINKMKAKGIVPLSYFVEEGYTYESTRNAFRKMYGNEAKFIDITSVVQITKTINEMFLEKGEK